jgi:hypothetical protein
VDCAKECPTDAGTAEMAAITNTKARVILVNMVFLLVLKPGVVLADLIAQRGLYSCGGI